jgi:hypothetical protein
MVVGIFFQLEADSRAVFLQTATMRDPQIVHWFTGTDAFETLV